LEITRIRMLRGPNLWSRHTALEAIVSCEKTERSIDSIPQFENKIRERFPQLGSMRRGGQNEVLSLAHALEHAALGLQAQAGCPVTFSRTVQTIDDGVVTVQIVEAHIGQIELSNHSEVNTDFLRDTLSMVQPGMVIAQTTIDDMLQSLLDVPGILPAVAIRPGQTVGSSDLVLDIQPGAGFNGDTTLDNYGGRFTGQQRLTANLQWYNLAHRGEH